MQAKLSLETLSQLDGGRVGDLVNQEITRAVNDADLFGSDEKVRKVAIEIRIEVEDGAPLIKVKAQAKLPPRESGATPGQLKGAPGGAYAMFETPLAEGEVA